MPTAQEYEQAARRLRALADRCDDEVGWAPRSPAGQFIGPGSRRTAIDSLVATAVRALAVAADDLRSLSGECLRRAAVCHEYHRQLDAYHGVPPAVRAHMAQPSLPAAWVDWVTDAFHDDAEVASRASGAWVDWVTDAFHYDPEVASRASGAWIGWADRINRTAHDLRWDLRRWALDEPARTAPSSLDEACTQLWTAAELTDLLTAAVRDADRAAFADVGVGALLALSRAIVFARRPGRMIDGRRHARTEWLHDVPAGEARAWFDRRHPGGPVAALAELDGDRVLRYWELLTVVERAHAIVARPDLVAFRVLANGGHVEPDELDLLDTANAYPVFSEAWAAEFQMSVGVRLAEIAIGAGARAIVTKLSDGSVEMVVTEEAGVGVGADLSAPGFVTVEASIGGLAAFQQRFRFPGEDEANAAIHTLIRAARQDASLGELVGDAGRWMFNRWAHQVNAPADLANSLVDLMFGVEPIPTVPAFDLTPELARALQRLWDTNAVSRTDALGVQVTADAELELEVTTFEAEIGADAAAKMVYYDADGVGGRAGENRSGVMLSGTVGAEAEIGVSSPGGSRTSSEGAFVLDLYNGSGGTQLTVSLVGAVAVGATAELLDLPVAELDAHGESAVSASIEITVPVDRSTMADVGEIGRLLAGGMLPVRALTRLHDRAEISAEFATGRRTTAADVEVDGGVVEVDGELAYEHSTTRTAWRKYPHGEAFSPTAVDRLVEGAR